MARRPGHPSLTGAARRGAAAVLAALLLLAALPGASFGGTADSRTRLRREKAKLEETRRLAEKAAGELARTIEGQKSSRERLSVLRERLARQRRTVARLDGRIAELSVALERTEREIREIGEARDRSARGLAGAQRLFFLASRETACPDDAGTASCDLLRGPSPILHRHFAARVLAAESGRLEELGEEARKREDESEGIGRRLARDAQRIEEERRVREELAARRREEERRLSDLEERKARKEKEVRELKARVARMETLIAGIERRLKARDAARRGGKPPASPGRFASLPGGLLPPLKGRIVTAFGTHRDPVFDVTIENRGVEIEAPPGSPFRAVAKGEVVFRGTVTGFGRVLILEHGPGLFSVYGKAGSYRFGEGRRVAAGEVLGTLPADPDGQSVLYLELRAAGTAIDPASVIPLSR